MPTGLGEATSYIARKATVIKSFFSKNFVIISTPAKYELSSVYESKRVLTQEEVTKMIDATPKLEESRYLYPVAV